VRGLREVAEVGAELILLNPVFDEAEQMERPDGRSGAEALVVLLGETFGAVVEGWTATRRTSPGRVQFRVPCRKTDRGRQSVRPGQ
jgi:hypothetical protein